MLNKVILQGNIGRDPEIKLTQKGKKIATFSLATSFSWKDETGEWQTHTDWHRISVFKESSVRWIADILKKGGMVYVEGKLSYYPSKDKYGQVHFRPHVVVENGRGHVEFLRSSQGSAQITEPDSLEEKLDSHKEEVVAQEALSLEETLLDFSSQPHFPTSQPNREEGIQ